MHSTKTISSSSFLVLLGATMGGRQSTDKNHKINNDTTSHSQPTTTISLETKQEDWPWVWALRDGSVLDWKRKEFLVGNDDDDERSFEDTGAPLDANQRIDFLIEEQAKRQQDLPVQISDSLYLGNANSIQDVSKLKRKGITAVLNMAGRFALPKRSIQALKNNNITYKRIDAQDEPDYPLLQNHWMEAKAFLDQVATTTTITIAATDTGETQQPGKCVVHCVAGMNRSALIAAAYYMTTTRTPILQTVQLVRFQRGNVALQNEGFQQQLVALARQENLLGNLPGTDRSMVKESAPPMPSDWRAERRQKPPNPLDRLD